MWKIGTRIKRLWNIYDEHSKYRYGTICARVRVEKASKKEKYLFEYKSLYGPYNEIYAVVWDDDPTRVAWGFLGHGFERE